VSAASPYAHALTRAVSAVASHADIVHPLTTERTDTKRAGILVITADRGMAGAYSVNAVRESERLRAQLLEEGKEVVQYVTGRRGVAYFHFRHRAMARSWTGNSDAPSHAIAADISRVLLDAFLARPEDGGLAEIHIVYTQFRGMVTQVARVLRLVPLEVVEGDAEDGEQAPPLYDFEPSAREVLDALLPRYVEARIYACLLQSAASELAARQRAMNTATTNAEDMIRKYTRLANQARQSEITQEISEIVSGADALAAAS
jgi:F-type H+-transporting ATPase subunit gamma